MTVDHLNETTRLGCSEDVLCRSAPNVWAVTDERFSFLKPQATLLLEKQHLLLRICSVMTVIQGFWDAGGDIFERQRDLSHAPPRFARSTKDNARSLYKLRPSVFWKQCTLLPWTRLLPRQQCYTLTPKWRIHKKTSDDWHRVSDVGE